MSKVDWSKAPEGAEFYARGFRKECEESEIPWVWTGVYWCNGGYSLSECKEFNDYEPRPQQWPESEERVNIIGQNGNDGLVYELKPTYNRDIIGLDGTKTTVDVYRVLDAFKTESAAIDHAIKKLLCAGIRHQKDRKQDLEEAIKSIQAELLLMSQR